MRKVIAAAGLAVAATLSPAFGHTAGAQTTNTGQVQTQDNGDNDSDDSGKAGLLGLLGLLGLAGLLRKPQRDDDRVVVSRTGGTGSDAGARSSRTDR